MIIVNIEKLEALIQRYSKLVEEYENYFFAIEHEYDLILENWQSDKMQKFYQLLDEQKITIKKIIFSLKLYSETLQSICVKYKEIGNNIVIDLDSKEMILENIESITKNFDKVKKDGTRLVQSPDYVKSQELLYELEKLKISQENFLNMKEEILNLYEKVGNIEQDIHAKLGAISEGKN